MTDARPDPARPLDGRTVLVTGGNGGIGLGMARACGRAGAQIVIWGRKEDKNAEAVAALEADGTTAHALACDITELDRVHDFFRESVEMAGGRIDTVFANAGTTGRGVPFLEVDLEEWHRVLRLNLDAAMLTLQAGARHMVEHGGGALVAVSSTSAIHGAAGNEAYGTSKSALLGLTRALAVALARHQIRVNALLPGWTKTDLAAAGYAWDKFREATISRTPARRWADPEEMGPAAVFLADPTTTFHTGDTVVVDGGYTVF
ncbi:MAG TPA: SDR family oxidoreductase [Acidimicrobiales bacterium]|nr:SDR family oxidoreductase [Acidimicrobiales bacterium]